MADTPHPWIAALSIAAVVASCLGCHGTGEERCDADGVYPPGAIPAPAGTSACQWQVSQMELAEQDDWVIYQREWQGDSAALDWQTQGRLEQLVPRLQSGLDVLRVEPSGFADLDQARRTTLETWLEAHEITPAADRVTIGRPIAEGMAGTEAGRVARQFVLGGQAGGTGSNSGNNAGGSNSGAGGGQGSFGGGGVF